jgi:ribonuclease HI
MGKENLVVFTDGSCLNNGKNNAVGGIGIHFPDKELIDISKIYNKGSGCTNQKTELYAILLALKYIHSKLGLSKYRVFIKTDSMYSINCVTNWINNWIKNGWKTKVGTPVANKKLIEEIYYYYDKYTIIFEHVDAHTKLQDYDSKGNEMADSLARKATEKASRQSTLSVKKYRMDGSRNVSRLSRMGEEPKISLVRRSGSKSQKTKKSQVERKPRIPIRKSLPMSNYYNKKISPNEIIVELVPARE